MKIAGASFLLSGSLLFGMVYLAIAGYAAQLTGWSDPPGKFIVSLEATLTGTPLVLSIVFMAVGSLLLGIALYKGRK